MRSPTPLPAPPRRPTTRIAACRFVVVQRRPRPKGEPAAEPSESVPRPTPGGEAPGEILGRQARELLDTIAASELPSALVFLEFLRDRGSTSLLGLTGPATAA